MQVTNDDEQFLHEFEVAVAASERRGMADTESMAAWATAGKVDRVSRYDAAQLARFKAAEVTLGRLQSLMR